MTETYTIGICLQKEFLNLIFACAAAAESQRLDFDFQKDAESIETLSNLQPWPANDVSTQGLLAAPNNSSRRRFAARLNPGVRQRITDAGGENVPTTRSKNNGGET